MFIVIVAASRCVAQVKTVTTGTITLVNGHRCAPFSGQTHPISTAPVTIAVSTAITTLEIGDYITTNGCVAGSDVMKVAALSSSAITVLPSHTCAPVAATVAQHVRFVGRTHGTVEIVRTAYPTTGKWNGGWTWSI